MFKAIGRIGKEKTVFDVEFKPIDLRVYSDKACNIKFQVQRGK